MNIVPSIPICSPWTNSDPRRFIDLVRPTTILSPTALDDCRSVASTFVGRKIERRKIRMKHLSAFDFSARSFIPQPEVPVAQSLFFTVALLEQLRLHGVVCEFRFYLLRLFSQCIKCLLFRIHVIRRCSFLRLLIG